MIIKFDDATINTDTVTFTVSKGDLCEIHFMGGEVISIPEKATAGFFSGAPTVESLMKLQEEQVRASNSGIVKPNIVMR